MKEISVQELKQRMDEGAELRLLDVREPDEHAAFNIGGTLFPLGNILSFQLEDIDELKHEELIVYCRSGRRSLQACMVLEQAGFTNVQNMTGGVLEWQAQFGQ